MGLCFEIKLCKLIDISKYSKCENWDFWYNVSKEKFKIGGLYKTMQLHYTVN